ncbi:translocation protein Sec72 [Ceratobasidium sp. AG-Ba]|nr:translocation protein Sec72 [Ceratobasidium sp. AG-Ba]
MSQPQVELLSPATTAKMARIQSWQRSAQLQASEPHTPVSATSTTRRHSAPSPVSSAFDVRVMPAPAVPQVQVHLAEPRPVLHHTHSHVASLHSWDGANEDLESRAGLRMGDRDAASSLGRNKSWRARAARMSRAIFGPSSGPLLPPWRALNVEKHSQVQPVHDDQTINVNVRAGSDAGRNSHKCPCQHHKAPQRKQKRMFWCILLILLILLAVADIIFLNVRVFNPNFIVAQPLAPAPTSLVKETVAPVASTVVITSAGSTLISVTTASITTTISASATPSAAPSILQNCLTQFELNAPSSPTSYPCDTCFSALSNAPASAGAGPATQFCAMKAIFDSAGTSSSTNSGALASVGWMKDAKPCGWSGVNCDSNGNIIGITLTFPGIPAAIPSELSSVSTLTSLKITGDGNLPSGSLPALGTLTGLDIENTGISALSDGALSKSLTSLTLVRNSKMGSALPNAVGSLSLKSLIINGQSITSFGPIFTSSSLSSSLQTLDLSFNSITDSLPSDLSSMSSLVELNLSANDISAPFPSAMPNLLQVLILEGNSKLSGTLPSSMCSSTALAQSNFRKPSAFSSLLKVRSTMADHGHSHDGPNAHGHSHDGPGGHNHSHSPQPGPPQQLLNPDPIDPALQADMDASFKPRPVKLVGPEGHTTCQAVCIEHGQDKCDDCGVDYSDLNLLARMLVQAPNLIVPPPPQVTDKSRSAHVAKFKDEGNTAYKAGKWAPAIQSYTMSANIAASRPNWEPHSLAREEISTVLSNRSAAHLSAGDYIPALVDADVVIALRKPWTKGHFRKAKALVALQCYEEARDAIAVGLQFEPDNKELLDFMSEVDGKIAAAHPPVKIPA